MNIVGVVLAFIGSFMQGIGILFQKRAQSRSVEATGSLVRGASLDIDNDDESESGDDLAYLRSSQWRAGFAIFLTGSITGFVAVGMIGPSLLVVISSSSLLTNVLLSPALLNEARRNLDWASVVLIVAGISQAIIAIESSDKKSLTVDETVECIRSRRAISVWATLIVLFLGLMLICRITGREPENKYVRSAFAVRAGLSGILGVMLATPTSLLLQNPTLEHPILLVLAAFLIVQVVLDIHVQNRSLKFNDMMFHGPVTFCTWQIGTIVAGSITYNETEGFTKDQWILGGTGCACVAIGVALSATRPFPNSPGYMVVTRL